MALDGRCTRLSFFSYDPRTTLTTVLSHQQVQDLPVIQSVNLILSWASCA